MTAQSNEARYWVLGGRWVDNAKHLPWPKVFGPYRDYRSARASAEELSRSSHPDTRYLVVADVLETTGSTPCARAEDPLGGRR